VTHLRGVVEAHTDFPLYAAVVQHIATASGRSFDRIEQALLRLHPHNVVIGYSAMRVLTVVPADHASATQLEPVEYSETFSGWLAQIEDTVATEYRAQQRGLSGAEIRRALITAGHPITTQVVSKGLLALLATGKVARELAHSRVASRTRPRWVWGPRGEPLRPDRVLIAQHDQVHAIVDEVVTQVGRPVSRAEIKAWVIADLPGASETLRAHHAAITRMTRRLLPILLAQHPDLTTYRPSDAARGTLGPRYAVRPHNAQDASVVALEDAMERYAFAEDCTAEDALRQAVRVVPESLRALLQSRVSTRAAVLHASVSSPTVGLEALQVAEQAAERIMAWLHDPVTRKAAGTAYNRAQRVLLDAPVVRQLITRSATTPITDRLVGSAGLRDWDTINAWHNEVQTVAPRARRAPSILSAARRFPVPHRIAAVETAETALDVVDTLKGLLATAPLPVAKTVIDGVWMLLGTILRDPAPMATLVSASDVPPFIRRTALVATTLLGGSVDIDPMRYAHQRQDLDALAFAAAVDPSSTTADIVAILEPITLQNVPMRSRAMQLIRRAQDGARLTLIDDR
jgi:hypothetical protein